MEKFQQRKGELREQIESLDIEIEKLKQARKDTAHHIAVKSSPEEDRFTRLRTERKHFIDTIKMIAYRAETSSASLLTRTFLLPPTIVGAISFARVFHVFAPSQPRDEISS